jgi:hypothetical protein
VLQDEVGEIGRADASLALFRFDLIGRDIAERIFLSLSPGEIRIYPRRH